MNPLIVGALLRHVLSAVGGAAAAGGFGSGSEWEQVAGGLTALVSIVMSIVNKKRLSR